jgi:hypothetical protein
MYLRASRAGGGSGRREYLTALRRETAKYGRSPDLVEFDCFFLCMSCGHLSDPRVGDPMRREAHEGPRNCAMCGAVGLVDLRQTPMVHSLSALETSEEQPSLGARVGKVFRVLGLAGTAAGLLAFVDSLGVSIVVIGTALAGWAASSRFVFGPSVPRRSLPRRWRMPQTSKRPGAQPHRRVRAQAQSSAELLRAPLSGRPCIAYEVAVRDDDDATGSPSSWRLVEQDNVGFRVGELEVAPGEALLQLRRELLSKGTIGSENDAIRRYLRMRGLLDSEAVYIYETILAPADACELSRRKADAPVLVRKT